MSTYNKLVNNLEVLKLNQIKENINTYIDLITKGEKTVVDAFYELTKLELHLKNEKAMNACVKVANFPFRKTLDDFEFSFQPTVNEAVIRDLHTLRFIENKENILFCGNPGVGKTHLSVSIGIAAARKRYSTYFINCHDLLLNLKKANLENRLETRLKHYTKYRVLIIDEIGYLPISVEESNMLFQLINKRYEKACTIITTNKEFSKWGEIFGDNTIANAILDRLLHHSTVQKITGKSYRIKDKISSANTRETC